jgi:hypothetical protein
MTLLRAVNVANHLAPLNILTTKNLAGVPINDHPPAVHEVYNHAQLDFLRGHPLIEPTQAR